MSNLFVLKRPRDVHWYLDDDEYESISRTMFDQGIKSISEYHRLRMLMPEWRKDLEMQRKRHRKAGIPDQNFWHSKRLK
jgi:hypothetical protein